MATIQNILRHPNDTENRSLYFTLDNLDESVKKFVEKFNERVVEIQGNRYLLNEEKTYQLQRTCERLSKQFNELNKVFREMLKMSPKSKRHSIYCLSFQKYNLKKIAELTFNWNYYWNKSSKQYDKVKKPNFSIAKFRELALTGLSFLYVKYGRLYEFQFIAQVYKTLIEWFDVNTLDFNDWKECYMTILNADINVLKFYIDKYQLVRERKYKKKTQKDLPPAEKYREWQNNGVKQNEIQQLLAKQYGCSPKTIQRDMERKGLTMKKYSRYYQPQNIVDKENRLKMLVADIEEFYSKC